MTIHRRVIRFVPPTKVDEKKTEQEKLKFELGLIRAELKSGKPIGMAKKAELTRRKNEILKSLRPKQVEKISAVA